MDAKDYKTSDEIAWCPGCGNFGILNAIRKTLAAMEKDPKDVLLVSGIGQAAKTPHYVRANCFNGLHGRALPAAAGAKIANRELTVIVTTGDGDCYGEGGNHFLHNIRRNIDMTVIVHDNQIYGLTKGQASPTTDPGYTTKVQTDGVVLEPFHPLSFAIGAGCGFVARSFSTQSGQLSELIAEGIRYKGFALIDVLQPCVSFNRKNTHSWYRQRVYDVAHDGTYDPSDIYAAYGKAREWGERIPTGIIYKRSQPPQTFEQKRGLEDRPPLNTREPDAATITEAVQEYL
jgi:2-oxoglutarate ferredoxin oxidoreductase subunit beta